MQTKNKMDIKDSINKYSNKNGYPISEYKDVKCPCGNITFQLYSDDDEGGAYVVCSSCGKENDIENSRKYIEYEQQNICNCDNENLNIGVGKAFYPNSTDPRWVYVGASCSKCNLAGVYVDWKEN